MFVAYTAKPVLGRAKLQNGKTKRKKKLFIRKNNVETLYAYDTPVSLVRGIIDLRVGTGTNVHACKPNIGFENIIYLLMFYVGPKNGCTVFRPKWFVSYTVLREFIRPKRSPSGNSQTFTTNISNWRVPKSWPRDV